MSSLASLNWFRTGGEDPSVPVPSGVPWLDTGKKKSFSLEYG